MEHLPLPSRLFVPREEVWPYPPVECICDPIVSSSDSGCSTGNPVSGEGEARFYDGGEFRTYPTRVGPHWAHFILYEQWEEATAIHAETEWPSDDHELAKFLQSWLFFGLLHATLNPLGLYDEREFYDVDPQGPITLHTKSLRSRLDMWRERVRAMPIAEREDTKRAMNDCLRIVYQALQVVRNSLDLHVHFDARLRECLVSLSATVTASATAVLSDVLPHRPWPPCFNAAAFGKDDGVRLRQLGWCPSLIAAESRLSKPCELNWYYLHLGQPHVGFDHSTCTSFDCRFAHIDPTTYSLPHDHVDCICEPLGPDLEDVAQCLDAGTFPVFDVLGESIENVRLEIVPRTDSTAYVALSHIWADGLGNPNATTLRRCQLLCIRRIVDDIRDRFFLSEMTTTEKPRLFIWCDTLLCPIQLSPSQSMTEEDRIAFLSRPDVSESHRLKRLALGRMKRVYQDATYVLVLDRMLQACRSEYMDDTEIAFRLITSRWNSRVWTLQEGALPRKVLVQFLDRLIDVDDIVHKLQYTLDHNVEMGRLVAHCLRRLLAVRGLLNSRRDGGMDVFMLVSSIQHRQVQCPEDEALVLGAVSNLDGDQIAAFDDHSGRMGAFWRIMAKKPPGLPANIIFNYYHRLDRPGLRWAPSSLRSRTGQDLMLLAEDAYRRRGRHSDWGLCCQFSGWQIRTVDRHDSSQCPAIMATMSSYLLPPTFTYVKGDAGEWHVIKPVKCPASQISEDEDLTAILAAAPHRDWQVILSECELAPGSRIQEGLLGYVDQDNGGVFRTHAVLLAYICLKEKSMINLAAARAKQLQQSFAHRILFGLSRLRCVLEWMPGSLAPGGLAYGLIWCTDRLTQYWQRIWIDRLEELSRLRTAYEREMWGEGWPHDTIAMAPLICMHLTGQYLCAIRTFSDDHEWVVD